MLNLEWKKIRVASTLLVMNDRERRIARRLIFIVGSICPN